MSESRANLEQILELLLAEETEQAEELLHEYVVAKARQQYERVLDESEEVEEDLDESEEVDESSCGSKKKKMEEEEVDETIDHSDPSADYVEDVTAIEDAVEADEFGEGDDEDDGEMEMDGDVEDKIDDLEDELAALKAEFEKLMKDDDEEEDADDAMDAAMDADADEIEFDDQEMESVEYELDEDFDDQIDEATKLSDQVSPQKTKEKLNVPDPGADNTQSPFTNKPAGTTVEGAGSPVVIKDGGEGDHGDKGVPNPQDPGDHNIGIEPEVNSPQQTKAKLSVPNPGEDAPNSDSPFTDSPR